MIAKRWLRRVYLWSGAALAVQAFIWLISGAVMSWFPLALVEGASHLYTAPPPVLEALTYASPGGIIAQAPDATHLELQYFLGKPVYRTHGPGGAAGIYDASTGVRISPLSEALARKVAAKDYVGEGKITRARLVSFSSAEYHVTRPVWRVDFSDRWHTRLYILTSTGEIDARRNDIWQLYNVFRLLHFMDYGEHGTSTNPMIKIASVLALIFAFSGMTVLGMFLRHRLTQGDLLFPKASEQNDPDRLQSSDPDNSA